MPVKSVGFAIGNLRARENRLLKAGDMAQLCAAKSTAELAKLLRDKDIGRTDTEDVVRLLTEDTELLWQYLTENAPDMAVFEPFLYENDFHNYKAVLKATVRSADAKDLLIVPANVDPALLERAVKEKRFDLLPGWMQESAEKSYTVLLQTGDPQLTDGILDAACMNAQLNKAGQSGIPLIKRILTETVFFNNIKIALRAARAQKPASFLEETLSETGVISKKAMITAALAGEEKVLELLAGLPTVGGVQAAECYRRSAAAFEKFCDNRILLAARSCKYVTLGAEPLIGYMLARKAEIKNLRIIYSGVKTGQPPEKIEERLRELYG